MIHIHNIITYFSGHLDGVQWKNGSLQVFVTSNRFRLCLSSHAKQFRHLLLLFRLKRHININETLSHPHLTSKTSLNADELGSQRVHIIGDEKFFEPST